MESNTTQTNDNINIKPSFNKKVVPKKSPKMFLGILSLIILVLGGLIGLYLTKKSQDLRQQADQGDYATNDCSSASAARCQGKDPGDSCGDGTCKSLPNQLGNDGKAKCTCDRPDDPKITKTPVPTTPPGCHYEEVQCIQAPCDPILVCITPTTPPSCTQETGECIGADGSSCVSYTDGCQKAEKCAKPLEACSVPVSGYCESCNGSLPPSTPNSRCESGLTCANEEPGIPGISGLCVKTGETVAACQPTPTIEPIACGSTPCSTNTDCSGDLICIIANDSEKYCTQPEYKDSCIKNPNTDSCCNEPTDVPSGDDDSSNGSSSSSYSESNSSATVNITNENNTTVAGGTNSTGGTTTSGGETAPPSRSETVEPTLPPELPKSGPEDWIEYLQVGLGALGIGALLILFL